MAEIRALAFCGERFCVKNSNSLREAAFRPGRKCIRDRQCLFPIGRRHEGLEGECMTDWQGLHVAEMPSTCVVSRFSSGNLGASTFDRRPGGRQIIRGTGLMPKEGISGTNRLSEQFSFLSRASRVELSRDSSLGKKLAFRFLAGEERQKCRSFCEG
ncbi:hypothetical protein H2509_11060 [Stappia sp. F7233]|uniref:Uncharacterized protein n=1 Tax=Stappia albiluteola TaxID=2758565 RepID=A0A839AFJ5_9HYPH|nr:hypothetical protein [Stappia albiluteola]MBA5777662.1 hypothetical protein [Stappia albiluteola]